MWDLSDLAQSLQGVHVKSVGLLVQVCLVFFAGSWHCGLMCGPLLSWATEGLPSPAVTSWARTGYHLGRWLSYLLLALCFWWLADRIAAAMILRHLSAGALVGFALTASLWLVLRRSGRPLVGALSRLPRESKLPEGEGRTLARILFQYFALGFMNFLIPCHWLTLVLLVASQADRPTAVVALTSLFWVSTLFGIATWNGVTKVASLIPGALTSPLSTSTAQRFRTTWVPRAILISAIFVLTLRWFPLCLSWWDPHPSTQPPHLPLCLNPKF